MTVINPLEAEMTNLRLDSAEGPIGRCVKARGARPQLLTAYKAIAVGDGVLLDGVEGVVSEYLKKGLVKLKLDDGTSPIVDASKLEAISGGQAEAADLRDALVDAQAKARATPPVDPYYAENLPPEILETLPPEKTQGFWAPTAEALAALPRPGDEVKVSDGKEAFWVLVSSCEGDVVVGQVVNELAGGQLWKFGSKVAFLKRHIHQMEVYLPANELSDAEAKARYLGVRREGGTGPGWAEDKVLSGSDAALVAEAEFTRRIRDGFEAGSDDPLNKFLDKAKNKLGVPVLSPLAVAEFFREHPEHLAGTGLDASDVGCFRLKSSKDCDDHEQIHSNLVNMTLSTRVEAICFDA
mmetsp:Transcript_26807/g.82455  ORF Transcript_26807/g.82455 Transcript_26807/m.82455 type:complete len:353 (+) Transcript_26807:461-1519(+)